MQDLAVGFGPVVAGGARGGGVEIGVDLGGIGGREGERAAGFLRG